MTDFDRRAHWEDVYRQKAETAVSWYQAEPALSLKLIRAARPETKNSVIDIGGGASTLVDALIGEGRDVTVLDLSETALSRSRARLGAMAEQARWIAADITAWTPPRQWDVWHDRAVFHFLTEPGAQDAYIAALKQALAPGGTAVMATFALDGPEKCSDLPVRRYSAETLAARLGDDFALTASEREAHATPWGGTQNFSYSVFKRL